MLAPKKSCATTLSNKIFMGNFLYILRNFDSLKKIGTGVANRAMVLEIILALCSSTACVKTLIELGKYKAKERASRNGSVVVSIFITLPSFKPVSM